MPVTQVMQGPGRWSIELNDSAPRALTNLFPVATEGFGHIVVTSARLDQTDPTPAVLLQLATYVGRYLGQKDRTSLYGDHINAWLGDANGLGIPGAINEFTLNQSFGAWIDTLQPDQVPFYQGTIGTPGLFFEYTWRPGDTQRAALDAVCRWFDCEWRVRNTMVFDADIWTNLYGATPRAIATPWWDGRDVELTGIRSTILSDTSLERYAEGIYGVGAGGTGSNQTDPAAPFDLPTPGGPGVTPGIYLTGASQVSDTDLVAFLQAEGAERWERAPTIKVSTDDFCPLDAVSVGAPLYVYDPDSDVYDTANEVHYGGQIVWPKILRVQAIVDMPVREGMGVYFRTPDDVFDLTDYVKFETGSTRIEVGERVRSLRPAMKRRGYDA